jgi:hypothetical protein
MSNFEFFTSSFDIQDSIFDIKNVRLVTLLLRGVEGCVNQYAG